MAPVLTVRGLQEGDSGWKLASLQRHWGATEIARDGELVDAARLAGFVALVDDEPVGLLTYQMRDGELEVVSLHTEREGIGAGRALMDAAHDHAADSGARRMWLRTTNDNIRAYRFYQRWGMTLAALDLDAVARSRTVKPSIPLLSDDGVAVRHELEFELVLAGSALH